MDILITGGTGLIGSALSDYFLTCGHRIWVVSRTPSTVESRIRRVTNLQEVDGDIDVVINLAGAGIADARWSAKRKAILRSSRVDVTTALVKWIRSRKKAPELLISASAIGFYGVSSSDVATDETMCGDDSFSSSLCREWEEIALTAGESVKRVVLLRTGIVLSCDGGALKRMLLPFKLGLGGRIGSGEQWMSWIDIKDMVNIVRYLIESKGIEGPVNATAPNPVRNTKFTEVLGTSLKRPTLLPMPSFMVSAIWGQMGRELLLSGKKVVPQKLVGAGFKFEFSDLESSLSRHVN